MVLSRNDYRVLYTIYQYGCTTEMKSLTILKLSDLSKLSESKVRMTIKRFKEIGYLRDGAVHHNAKTYYVTPEGITKIIELMGEE